MKFQPFSNPSKPDHVVLSVSPRATILRRGAGWVCTAVLVWACFGTTASAQDAPAGVKEAIQTATDASAWASPSAYERQLGSKVDWSSVKVRSPLPGARMKVPFGDRKSPTSFTKIKHQGWTLWVDRPRPMQVVAPGLVVYVGVIRGMGNVVIVDHGGGYHSVYGGLGLPALRVGDVVETGKLVEVNPKTTTTERYFEWRSRGRAVNPVRTFPRPAPVVQGVE